jgi:hypothetical protein
VKGNWTKCLPYLFMLVAALSRWPGLFPPSFSALYALAFCAGAFFPRPIRWWLPLGTFVVTDICLDFYYLHRGWNVLDLSVLRYQLVNYAAYAVLIWFGSRFSRKSSFLALLGGGIFGAILFYLITNTASWLFNPFGNPEYTRNFLGWLRALTTGTAGWPQTWEFFRNTLMSGGLFTGLFAGAMKLSEAAESAKEKEQAEQPAGEPQGEPAPEESKA